MPMNYDNNEDSQMSGSIFSNPELTNPAPVQPPVQEPPKNDILSNFVRNITSKIIDPETGQNIFEKRKFEKIFEKMAEENAELFQVMNEFGAKFVYKVDGIDIVVERLSMAGTMTIEDNGEVTLDDNAREIFYKMAHFVNNWNSFEYTMNMYAEVGFYPVGDLTNVKVKYKGRELEVLKGALMNDKGETRDFYMYNGHEILLDNEENS